MSYIPGMQQDGDVMSGFPPPPAVRVDLSNWQQPDYLRWSFRHLRELIPTHPITAAGAAARLFAVEHQPDPGDGVEAAAAIFRDQLGKGFGHAVELQRAQRLVGGVGEQG